MYSASQRNPINADGVYGRVQNGRIAGERGGVAMPELSMDDVVSQLLAVFREAFEGPPEKWSYFRRSRR